MKYYYYTWFWDLKLKPYYINVIIQFKNIFYYQKFYYFIFFKDIKFKIGMSKY